VPKRDGIDHGDADGGGNGASILAQRGRRWRHTVASGAASGAITVPALGTLKLVGWR